MEISGGGGKGGGGAPALVGTGSTSSPTGIGSRRSLRRRKRQHLFSHDVLGHI